MNPKLLERDKFRELVFERDKNTCVVTGCGKTGLGAHHLIERRLWAGEQQGGYFLDNGVTLCDEHHIMAETTELSATALREMAGIVKPLLPAEWYPDCEYTKWGDIILTDGRRTRGPLFNDASVQKVLAMGPYLPLYTELCKYPRSIHLPWSEGKTSDDRTLADCSCFEGREVVVTRKMDGENTTLYRNRMHARSLDSRSHWSRGRIKELHASIGHEIPEYWRICGENMVAKHTLAYDDLEAWFLVFSIWDEHNVCLSWDETVEYAKMLGLTMVPLLWRGTWDKEKIQALYSESDRTIHEGYVVRLVDHFEFRDFSKSLAKFVRREHVETNQHWFHTATEENKLKI